MIYSRRRVDFPRIQVPLLALCIPKISSKEADTDLEYGDSHDEGPKFHASVVRPERAPSRLCCCLPFWPFCRSVVCTTSRCCCFAGLDSGAWVPRPREVLGDDGLRLLLVLFLCVWLPMAVAAVDAVDPVQSWRKVLSFPVFFLAGAYVVRATRHQAELRRLLLGVWAVCIIWSIDASWQFVHELNLFGFPYQGGRVSGIFHPDLKLGIVLATVSPLVLEATRQLAERSVWLVRWR